MEVPSSQMTIACVKLTQNWPAQRTNDIGKDLTLYLLVYDDAMLSDIVASSR